MFSFLNKGTNNTNVPEWADFFTEKEYQLFLGALTRYFSRKKLTFEIHDGVLTTAGENFGFEKLGLGNVSQRCKQHNLSDYNEIVEDHFEALIRSKSFEEEFHEKSKDFNYARTYLATRIYGKDYISHLTEEMCVTQEIAAKLYAMLVFDLPDSVMNVQPSLVKEWEKEEDELIQLGTENIQANYVFEIKDFQIDDLEIKLVQGDHFFVPNILFNVENHPELLGKYGSIVGIPHRHAALIYPIESMEVVRAVNEFIPIVFGMHHEGPGSITNQIFYLNEGELIDLPYSFEDEKLRFFPPAAFVQLLNQLADF